MQMAIDIASIWSVWQEILLRKMAVSSKLCNALELED